MRRSSVPWRTAGPEPAWSLRLRLREDISGYCLAVSSASESGSPRLVIVASEGLSSAETK